MQDLRWARQPQVPVVLDRSNPLTRRMVSCLELRSNYVQDLASTLVFNHTRPIVPTQVGRAASFDSTALINTGVTSINGQSLFATSGNPFTVSLLVRRTASNTYFAKASATSANRTFQIGEGGGVGDATPFVGIRGTFTNTNLGFSDSNWHLYTVVYDGTSATLFVDATATAALTVGTAAEETTENFTIGGRTASSPGSLFSGNVAFVRIWSRALSQNEHRSLWGNPWQIFVPQRGIVFSFPSGGGAYTITADAGSYALTGQAATLLRSYAVAGGFGSYALTGQAATLLRSYAVAGDFGSYALAGQDASLLRSFSLDGAYGTYTVAGQQATLSRSYAVEAAAGSYATDGQAATILFSRLLDAASGSYSVTGQGATVEVSGQPTPSVDNPLIKLRSFTERRRF